ncbi:MAG TPA: hypothetical protein VL551_10420 [Actinospica sp.]|nr:hypothetical protein [Actinospica sp.]
MIDQPATESRTPTEQRRYDQGPAAELSGPALSRRPAAQSGLHALDRTLLEMSWPLPRTRELAVQSVRSLERISGALTGQRPGIAEQDVRAGLDALLARAGFILPHWTGELAALAPDGWSVAHAEALALDLAELARTGAKIRDVIAAVPAPGPTVVRAATASAATGHRRTRARRPPGHLSPGKRHGAEAVIGAITELPPVSRRLLLQACAIIPAGLAVAAVCYVAFDRHHPAVPQAQSASTRTSPRAATSAATKASAWAAVSTGPAKATPAAQPVTSLQIQLLGASSTQPSVEAVVYLDTASPAPVEVHIAYHGTTDPRPVTESEQLVGRTSYQFALPIDAAPYCGGGVVVSAASGGFSASQTTTAGPCPTTSPGSTTE